MPAKNFTKTQQLVIPQTALQVGPVGPFTTGMLPAGFAGYEIDFNIDPAHWPSSGDVVTFSALGLNQDGSQNWAAPDSITLIGMPLYDPAVQYSRRNPVSFNGAWFVCIQTPPTPGIDPTNATYWGPNVPWMWNVTFDPGSPSVKLQLTVKVLQACTIGAVVSSL